MLLGQRNITVGDIRRYEVKYSEFLQRGDTVKTFTVTTVAPTSRVGSVSLTVDKMGIYIFIQAGVVGEQFTVNIQTNTAYGEQVNDTIQFQVVPA